MRIKSPIESWIGWVRCASATFDGRPPDGVCRRADDAPVTAVAALVWLPPPSAPFFLASGSFTWLSLCRLKKYITLAVVSFFATWSWSFLYRTQRGVPAMKRTASLSKTFLMVRSTMHITYSLRARGGCALGPVRRVHKQQRQPIYSMDNNTANERRKRTPKRQPQR